MPDQSVSPISRELQALRDAALNEFLHGHVDRRTLLRYASVVGLSGLGAALGLTAARPAHAATPAATAGRPTPLIRVAGLTPAGAIDPLTISDPASVPLLNQTCDYLVIDDEQGHLVPSLATAWKPNAKGDVWTFTLRDGVKFHDGQVLSAKDVVATFEGRHSGRRRAHGRVSSRRAER
jgi:peptide/nickel transport system substrate-binding protein